MPETKPPPSARRRIVAAGLVAVLVATLLTALLPVAAKRLFEQWLVTNGADAATIESLSINPFSGRLHLAGVSIDRGGKTVLAATTISLDLAPLRLFSREVKIRQAVLAGAALVVEHAENGELRIASYLIPAEPEPVPPPQLPPSAWLFTVTEAAIDDTTLTYADPVLPARLVIDRARLRGFSTAPGDKPAALEFAGSLNDAPLTISVPDLRIVPDFRLDGGIRLSAFPLAGLSALTGAEPEIQSGALSADGTLSVAHRTRAGLTAAFEGRLELAAIDLAAGDWAASGGLDWRGRLSFTQAAASPEIAAAGRLTLSPLLFSRGGEQMSFRGEGGTIDGSTTITLAGPIKVESNATISLGAAALTAPGLGFQVAGASWAGTLATGMGGKTVSVSGRGRLGLEALSLSAPEGLGLSSSRLVVDGAAELRPDAPLTLSFAGDIGLSEAAAENEQFAFAGASLGWHGNGSYTATGNIRTLGLAGTLEAGAPELELVRQQISVALEAVSLPGDVRLELGEQPVYSGTAALEATGLSLSDTKTPLLSLATLSIGGVTADGQGALVIARIAADDLVMPPSSLQPYALTAASAAIEHTAVQDLRDIAIDRATLTAPRLSEAATSRSLAQLEHLTVDNSTIRPAERLTVEKAMLAGGSFLGAAAAGTEPAVRIGEAEMTALNWTPAEGALIDRVIVRDLTADHRRTNPESAAPTEPSGSRDKPAAGQAQRSLPLAIGQVSLTGESSLNYHDDSLSQPFSTTVDIESLTVSDLDFSRPDEPLSYALEAVVDTYAPLSVSGTTAPLAATFRLEQRATLRNYPLASLSPYVIDAIGTRFEGGQLDLNSKLVISGDELAADNELVFMDLTVRTVHEELANTINTKLPVPLDTALDMLRDRDDNFTLSVPIEGRLSELNIGIADIIVTAFSGAIKKGLTPYLAYTALGPTGALAFLGLELGQALLSTDLPHLEFEPQMTELSDSHREILEKIGKELAEKLEKDNSLSYSICPKVVPGEAGGRAEAALDDEAGRKALFELGEKRALAVKAHLLNTHPIDEKALLICNPRLNYETKAKGVVEFRQYRPAR